MKIDFDPAKNAKNVRERDLSFERAVDFDFELDAFRAMGLGWQSRINEALKDWLKTHPRIETCGNSDQGHR
jgi:uncharacterized protein (DUF4415 family)